MSLHIGPFVAGLLAALVTLAVAPLIACRASRRRSGRR